MDEPINLVKALANEIERATRIREQFKSLRGMPNVMVEPQIAIITLEIRNAQLALGSGDAIECLKAYQVLKEYDE